MSVKCTKCDKSCSFRKKPFNSDYSALLARHNALVEAVAWERECDEFLKSKTYSFFVAWGYLQSARAEVDRLLSGDK